MSVLRELLQRAVEVGVSDVHIKSDAEPIFRVSGDLVKSGFEVLTREHLTEVIKDILPPHMTHIYEAEHEADFSLAEPGIGRFRVNLFNAQGAPTIAMRHVKDRIPTFEQLRLPPQMAKLAEAERGIILLAGTTGSGKSTTLACVINEINRTQRCRIITVEDPIEYLFDDLESVVTQREVGLDTSSFQNALKHLMRQDPDVILIGEMRDRNSIRTALLAAETGHLVLSTLHAGTSDLAIPRMLDVFPADEQDQIRLGLAGNLHAVVCQRLVPDIQGGVVPAVEIMINTSTVRKLIEKNNLDTLAAAIATGKEDGMQSFNQSIYSLIKSGLINEKEGMRYASNPESLRMNLQGIFLDEGSRILST
ncbi:MAG: twitching motility protein [Lentisphaerae bacterium RIFOXYC12_FULL_60_16]|nr:MAG: twitching motility protein [Lentisphaerae bacterium RIFOXYC12_FULL_60_16]OGV71704.1 MAG: twitching motility protein [Lentisphaerae bacterium RIFOXYA12_FULL_60_10]OGV75127.1 MAG: twitching motility protein [Lentisphaerae bacterium RIFOXYB12_FULL_60_10]